MSFGGVTHWTDQFSEFRGVQASPIIDKTVEAMFTTSIPKVTIDVPDVWKAVQLVRTALGTVYTEHGLSVIFVDADHDDYKKPIKISAENIILGSVVDLICKQAGLKWDFSGQCLTFRPKSKDTEPSAAPNGSPRGSFKSSAIIPPAQSRMLLPQPPRLHLAPFCCHLPVSESRG